MRILWISSLAWKEGEYKYPVNGAGAVSGSLFQQQMIIGLRKLGIEVDIIADYPYFTRENRSGWTYNCTTIEEYKVIPSMKSRTKERVIKGNLITKAVTSQIKKRKYDYAIAYLIHTPYMMGLRKAKKLGLKTVLICPDLPDMMDMSLKTKIVKQFLKKIDMQIQGLLYKSVDGFVLFSKYMTERLPINNKPYVVIEGVASLDSLTILKNRKKNNAIMHAGTLHKNIGIENMIKAFELIPDSKMELWLFGDGELRNYIQEKAKKDSRIRYFGFVDREKLWEYEMEAAALINARNSNDEYTRYSFPSKTFEYLYSGTPFITTWLEGIPDEYREYMCVIKDNNPETIAKVILDVENGRISNDLGEKARQFVSNSKQNITQAKKMVELLDEI